MIDLEIYKAKLKEAEFQHAITMNAKKKQPPIFNKKQNGGKISAQSSLQDLHSHLATLNKDDSRN